MEERTWDDGMQGAGLMIGLVPVVAVFVALRYQAWGAFAAALGLTPWPFLLRSGGQIRGRQFRSFTGWRIGSRWVRWGRWRRIESGDRFAFVYHKQSRMNHRGAPRASGVEYWDVVCRRGGREGIWHSFSTQQAAESAVVSLTALA
jgi:hypothetical protein